MTVHLIKLCVGVGEIPELARWQRERVAAQKRKGVAKPVLLSAELVKTGSVFQVLTAGFRLFVFEFSINVNFVPGPRTYTAASTGPILVLSQLQAENVGRAVRDLPFGYVRVRAVTTTNQIGTSDPYRFRR